MAQPEPFMRLLEAAKAMVEEYDSCCPDWWPESIEKLREAVEAIRG